MLANRLARGRDEARSVGWMHHRPDRPGRQCSAAKGGASAGAQGRRLCLAVAAATRAAPPLAGALVCATPLRIRRVFPPIPDLSAAGGGPKLPLQVARRQSNFLAFLGPFLPPSCSLHPLAVLASPAFCRLSVSSLSSRAAAAAASPRVADFRVRRPANRSGTRGQRQEQRGLCGPNGATRLGGCIN